MDSDEEDSAEEDDDLPDNAENNETNEEISVGPSGSDAGIHGAGFKTRMLEGLLRCDQCCLIGGRIMHNS